VLIIPERTPEDLYGRLEPSTSSCKSKIAESLQQPIDNPATSADLDKWAKDLKVRTVNLEAGQGVVVPPGFYHAVTNLEPSLSVNIVVLLDIKECLSVALQLQRGEVTLGSQTSLQLGGAFRALIKLQMLRELVGDAASASEDKQQVQAEKGALSINVIKAVVKPGKPPANETTCSGSKDGGAGALGLWIVALATLQQLRLDGTGGSNSRVFCSGATKQWHQSRLKDIASWLVPPSSSK
jgi:hypothetical protein